MVEESLDQANRCHLTAANLHTGIMVQEHLGDHRELTVDTRVHSMADPVILLQAHIPDTLALQGSNTMVLDHKEVQDGLLTPVVLHLTRMVE